MKNLTINGELKVTMADDLFALCQELDLPAALLLVEYNGEALARTEWDGVLLRDGDRLELLRVAAGV